MNILFIGRILSERINMLQYDLLFWGDLYFHPCPIDIPFVTFTYMTFEQVNIYFKKGAERCFWSGWGLLMKYTCKPVRFLL